ACPEGRTTLPTWALSIRIPRPHTLCTWPEASCDLNTSGRKLAVRPYDMVGRVRCRPALGLDQRLEALADHQADQLLHVGAALVRDNRIRIDVNRQLAGDERRELQAQVDGLPDLGQQALTQRPDARDDLAPVGHTTTLARGQDHDDGHELRDATRLKRIRSHVNGLAVLAGILDELQDVGNLHLSERLPHDRDL